jgi:hypothetical protein
VLPDTTIVAQDAGDFSRVAPIAWEVLRKPDAVRFTGMDEAMDVASGISRQRLKLFEQQVQASLLGDIVNFPMPHIGDALGVAGSWRQVPSAVQERRAGAVHERHPRRPHLSGE